MEDIKEEEENREKGIETPSLQSEDPAERKLARQQRLTRRHNAAKRLQTILEGSSESLKEKEHLIQTINDSNEKLFKIFVEGKELVTNIRVSSGTREIQRRDTELAARNARLKKLEEEAAVAQEKISIITNKWDKINDGNDPLDIAQELKEQRDRCFDLINQKDKLINDFKNELKLADERFLQDRNDMLEDISILAKRIDEQVLVMKRSYFTELGNVEDAIALTKRELVNDQEKEWKSLYEKREADEVTNLSKHLGMMETNEEEIQRVHLKHDELFRETKIRLETDVQALEQELECIKALCLVNSEKLDYNYQVLKKREDENVIIKNNQKRSLNKLQEEGMKLRNKIEEKECVTKFEMVKLNQEVCRLHTSIIDIEKKADLFSRVNDRKFRQIWDMKTQEASQLLDKIFAADKLIHEEILGIKWSPPSKMPLKKEDLISYQAAVAMVDELIAAPKDSPKMEKTVESMTDDRKREILKQILTLISDHTGFLQEEKLDVLLKPYSKDELTLVRLDNVFSAIGVGNKEDMELVIAYFIPYAKCEVCRVGGTSTTTAEQYSSTQCQQSHPLVIEKVFVLRALREFVAKLHESSFRENDIRLAKDRCTISRLISREDVNAYWASYRDVFQEDEKDVWTAIHSGLIEYNALLNDREKMIQKAETLRRQNSDLRSLVLKYVPHLSEQEENQMNGRRCSTAPLAALRKQL